MKAQADIVGGVNDTHWHGVIVADDLGYTGRQVALAAARADGFVRGRHTEVYLTHIPDAQR